MGVVLISTIFTKENMVEEPSIIEDRLLEEKEENTTNKRKGKRQITLTELNAEWSKGQKILVEFNMKG